ncbi:uncharacterized protein, partial [Chelonus insularis]|uniref:uncharacterized protein n=1 Tax=Chelonus insularis TaxID=460826 RepID=UPI00158C69DB
ITNSWGHGMLMDPVNRGSAWRKGFKTPINYDDNQNYCGGFNVHYLKNKGKCGPCGDDYSLKQPRPNENGGKFGKRVIVKTYTEGQSFTASVKITVNHNGFFRFAICPLKNAHAIETEECFRKHPLRTSQGTFKYIIKKSKGPKHQKHDVKLTLPKGLTCKHCSLRWHWKAANNWGSCMNGTSAIGCGPQETFRTCSDVRIIARSTKNKNKIVSK